MDPPPLVDGKMPFVLYNLGGCIVNLVTAALCFGFSFLCEAGTLGYAPLLLAAYTLTISDDELYVGIVGEDNENDPWMDKNRSVILTPYLLEKDSVTELENNSISYYDYGEPDVNNYWPDSTISFSA